MKRRKPSEDEYPNTITMYGSKEIFDKLDETIIKKYGNRMSEEEKIKEEYKARHNNIAENLNEKFKNPERALYRKHSGKEKFGSLIRKKLKKGK